MTKYKFEAVDIEGKTVKGVEVAGSTGAARLALSARGLQPMSVDEKPSLPERIHRAE